jgi:GTPase SAR1 family protein
MTNKNNSLTNYRLTDNDNYIQVALFDENTVLDHIPALVYTAHVTQHGEIHLHKDRPRFLLPERKYGDHAKHMELITGEYDRVGRSLGLLLIGQKGSGKSMLAEDLANWSIAKGMPVLLVNSRLPPDLLRLLIHAMGPCLVYFDEFGKVYVNTDDTNYRDAMLSLFSDTSMTGVIFVVTANQNSELSDFMLDRPGRFAYRIKYNGLTQSVVLEIAATYHLNDEFTKAMLRTSCGAGLHSPIHTNYDSVCRMAALARDVKTLDELKERMSVMNIPPLLWDLYAIETIRYKGQLADHIMAKIKDGLATFILLNAEGETVHTFTAQLDSADAVLLRGVKDGYLTGWYMLKVDDCVIHYCRQMCEGKDVITIYDITESDYDGIGAVLKNGDMNGYCNGSVRRIPSKTKRLRGHETVGTVSELSVDGVATERSSRGTHHTGVTVVEETPNTQYNN